MLLDFQKYSLNEMITIIRNESSVVGELIKDILLFLEYWNSDSNEFKIMSSGTTGAIKEMTFPKSALIASAKITLNEFDLKEGNLVLGALPLSFVAGKMMLVRAIVGKLKLEIVVPSTNPIRNLDEKIKFSAFTPHQLLKILNESPEKLKLFSKIIIGGSKVDVVLESKLQNYKAICYETFGMSETLTHIAIRKVNGKGKSRYFKVLDAFNWSVTEKGCLQVSARHLNESPIITKDIVEKVDEGHFLWMGREDNVINTGGVKVYPETIERKLASLIDIPFIISKEKDVGLGEKVIVYFESSQKDYILNNPPDYSGLSSFERPKESKFISEFTRSANGKINRAALNE